MVFVMLETTRVSQSSYMLKKLNLSRALCDPAFYVKVYNGHLEDLMGVNLDDTLMAGTVDFEKITESTVTTISSKPRI